jgi:uncharacterized cupin superfamily protein
VTSHTHQRLLSADLTAETVRNDGASPALGTATKTLWSDDVAEVGLWDAGPGNDIDVEADEVFLVLAGEGTVTFHGGDTIELKPGTLVRLYDGDRTTWEIADRVRKVYVALRESPGGQGRAGAARLLSEDVRALQLTRPSQPGMWVDGGWPTATYETMDELGGVALSVWETTAGVVADIERDEVVAVVSGNGTIRFDDGPAYNLRAGLCLRLRTGERAEWTVTTPMRLISVERRQTPSLQQIEGQEI